MQHLSIVLAFLAVFALAAYRVIDGQPQQISASAQIPIVMAEVPERDRIVRKNMAQQLAYLSTRVGELEANVNALSKKNKKLSGAIRQLVARDTLTTSSIGKPRTGTSTVFRKTTVPASGNGSLPSRQKGFGVHLATFADPSALGVAWRSLVASEEAALSKLAPFARSVTSSSGDTLYRLVAGPISSENDATALCRRLKARNRFCKMSVKLGAPLAQIIAKN